MFGPNSLHLSLRRTKFIYMISILTIYSSLSLYSYNLKMNVPKHLTQTICSAPSFSHFLFRYYVQILCNEPQYLQNIRAFLPFVLT